MTLEHLYRTILYDADSGGSGGDAGDAKNAGKTYTQEELDRIIGERAERAKNSANNELLTTLGVSSLDEAKAILAKHKEVEEASKTELQRAQEDAQAAKQAAEQAKAEQAVALAAARQTLLKAEVLRQIIAFKDANGNSFRPEAVDDVWLVLDKSIVTDKDDGTFDGVKEAVEKVAKTRPHWLIDVKQAQKIRGTPDGQKSLKQAEDKKTVATLNKRPFTL